jgi:hypothetical protein
MEQNYQISWYAPNFINMCIDNINDEELSGRIYHCYSKEPWKFTNILQLIELADDFFDKLEFPQASTSARSFTSIQFSGIDRLDKVRSPEDFIENRGQKGTFFLNVRYRQNSSWQGSVTWVEEQREQHFRSALELLKLIDGALDNNYEVRIEE